MENEDQPVKDIVPEPHETTPAPEHVPPVVNDAPRDDIRAVVNEIKQQVESLTETVSHVVSRGEPDTKPVKRPWTHWGSK